MFLCNPNLYQKCEVLLSKWYWGMHVDDLTLFDLVLLYVWEKVWISKYWIILIMSSDYFDYVESNKHHFTWTGIWCVYFHIYEVYSYRFPYILLLCFPYEKRHSYEFGETRHSYPTTYHRDYTRGNVASCRSYILFCNEFAIIHMWVCTGIKLYLWFKTFCLGQ